MKKTFYVTFILLIIGVLAAYSQSEETEWAINNYHRYYNEAKTQYARSLSEQAQAKYEFIFRVKILDFYNGTPLAL